VNVRTRKLFTILLVVSCIVTALPLLYADCPERIGHWPYGSTLAVALAGDHAVYGVGTVLRVAEISNPETPQVVAELRLENLIHGLGVSGSTVLAATTERGLVAVDLSDPAHPAVADEIGGVDMAIDLTIDGNLAWLAARSSGLIAVDISDPFHLQTISTLDEFDSAWNVAVAGDLAVVVDTESGLATVDISNPAAPVLLGALELHHAKGVAILGDYAYIADQFTGVQVVDISDPSAPVLVTTVSVTSSYCYECLIVDGRLLVAHRQYGVVVFDLSNPAAPVELSQLDTDGAARDMAYSDGRLLVADDSAGMVIADLANSAEPQQISSLESKGEVRRMAVSGSLAAAVSNGDLMLFDISDPADPVEITTLETTRNIRDLDLANDHAYLADEGLRILDLTDPGSPQELGTMALAGAELIHVSGTQVVSVSRADGLRVINAGDPTSPVSLGQLDIDFGPHGLIVSGETAYVAEYGAGLHIFDLSTPVAPVEVGMLPFSSVDHALAIAGDLLFIGDHGHGVRVLDITDPLAPTEVGQHTQARFFSGLGVAGNLLGIASIYDGFLVVDVTDPTSPTTVATSAMARISEADAEAVGNLVVITEEQAGVEVFDLSGCPGGPPDAGFTWAPASPFVGQEVQLTDISTGRISSRQWQIQGGGSSSDRNPVHTWSEAGSYQVTLTVTSSAGVDTQTHTVTVSEPPVPPITDPGANTWVIPASAHSAGAQGTSWVTDVVLHNPGVIDATANLYFMKGGQDNSGAIGQQITIPAASSVELTDIVIDLFGEGNAAGAILIGADQQMVVTSRTYNDSVEGTYGQFIPGLPMSKAIPRLASVQLIQLTRNDDFRTNIGFANPTGSELVVTIELLDADGVELVTTQRPVPAYGYLQDNNIFGVDIEAATALVWSNTVNAAYFVYASVVDNHTGDPVLVLEAEEAGELFIPAAAHVSGFEGTQWRTDLEILNDAAAVATCTVELLETGQANPSPRSAIVRVQSGAVVRTVDVLDELFDFSGTGALRVSVDREHGVVTSRTYNWTEAGTYGQMVAGVTADRAVGEGETGRLVQLHQSASDDSGYRTNIGLLNLSAAAVEVEIVLYSSDGTELGRLSENLAAFEHRQLNRVLREVTPSAVRNGYAVLSTASSGGRFLAYASVVDNASGDPIYIPAF
jgi:hypothetical protein